MKRMAKEIGGLVLRNGVYAFRRKENGRYIQTVLRNDIGRSITNKREALAVLRQLRIDQVHQAKARVLESRCGIRLTDLEERFLNHPMRPDVSSKHLRNYLSFLRQFLAFMKNAYPEVKFLHEISASMGEEFMGTYWKSGASAKSYNSCLNCLNIILKLFIKEHSPFEHIKRRSDLPEERYSFTEEQLKAIWKTLHADDYYMLHKEEMILLYKLALYTGLRCGDLCLLKWSQIDLTSRLVRLSPSKTRKSSRCQVAIPIAEPLYEDLSTMQKHFEYLMPNVAERYQRNPDGIFKDTIKLITKAGIQAAEIPETDAHRKRNIVRYSFHSFRHTFATILIENGASPMAVSRILGHSTLAMTNRYVHISTTTKQEILNAIPQIF